MAQVTYPTTSLYSSTPQTSWYLGLWSYRALAPDSGDRLYQLETKHQYRPDTLAYELYGSSAYWWVFAIRNPSLRQDPIWLFETGVIIVVPSADYVRKIIG